MRQELEQQLYEKFPSILISKDENTGEYDRCFLDIGDGWYDLIVAICDGILTNEDRIRASNNIAAKYGQELKKYTPVKAVQIKEKFGGLRFYISGGDEFVRGVIFSVEALSRKVCETCGQKGKVRNDGWMITLCDEHENERRWRKTNESKTVLPDSGRVG